MRNTIRREFVAAVLVVGLLPAAADADEALELHRAVWAEAATTSYLYAYRKFCECHRDEPPQTFVEVSGGEVVDVYHVHADSDRRVPARDGSLSLYWTIPDLFALIEAAEARDVTFRADYDAELGYPLRVYIDYDAASVGEEIDVVLTAFEARD
jgi:hypothetical protein